MRAFAVSRDGEREALAIDWKTVDGASGYRVDLARDTGMRDLVASEIVAAPPFVTEPLHSGADPTSARCDR